LSSTKGVSPPENQGLQEKLVPQEQQEEELRRRKEDPWMEVAVSDYSEEEPTKCS